MESINFRIRTVTAGANVKSHSDIEPFKKAISFLINTKKIFENEGYQVQTTRIALPHYYKINTGSLNQKHIKQLQIFDDLCNEHQMMWAIGDLFSPDTYAPESLDWIQELMSSTSSLSFHTSIASADIGLHNHSMKMAANICHMLAQNSKGGEANFRYTVSANCPPGVPYFPTAYHEGPKAFGIGLESANIFSEALENVMWLDAKKSMYKHLNKASKPIIKISEAISKHTNFIYNGIDVSTAPGLDASIGAAIEKLTQVPFGCASTLSACALITDVLKSLEFKTCGYSGLMLPVIEDMVLAQRATEERYTVEELLLFSAVSGTGLDVVPIQGNTPISVIEGLYRDLASLSQKYGSKILSARLFPIPGKDEGDMVEFDNPYLTGCRVMGLK
ncbi:MAG: DUF711 family protein [Saprospiraceae bacterium]